MPMATSRGKGPLPKKQLKQSDEGNFEPDYHVNSDGSKQIMDSDAEYKLFDYYADEIKKLPKEKQKGTLDLYTEMSMCDSCKGVKVQFERMFPEIKVNISHKVQF